MRKTTWYNKSCFPEFGTVTRALNLLLLIGLFTCLQHFLLDLVSAIEQIFLQRNGKQMDNNHIKINIWVNIGKHFLTTGATQADPCDTCIFLTKQSIRKAMEWAFYHLSGRQGVIKNLRLSDFKYLLNPYQMLLLCNKHEMHPLPQEIYHIRNHLSRKDINKIAKFPTLPYSKLSKNLAYFLLHVHKLKLGDIDYFHTIVCLLLETPSNYQELCSRQHGFQVPLIIYLRKQIMQDKKC